MRRWRGKIEGWWAETHGTGFELLRHFLLRFFDSDLITAPGHTTTALIGAFSIFFPWFPMVVGPLKQKYAYFSSLPDPGPYRMALRADELWLITMMMSAIGLLTAVKWQSLFPGLRDYRVLGSLPLTARQIFTAKLLALLIIATGVIVTLDLVPATMFPALSGGRWAWQASPGARTAVHALASVAASYFAFLALVAAQGVLLHVLRGRAFARVTASVQGVLVAGTLVTLVLSFSIDPRISAALVRPELARWLPPVWFLGLFQTLSGDPDPAMHALAPRAVTGLEVALALVLATYLAGYRRHRALLVEDSAPAGKPRRWRGVVFDWLVPDPRQQAVIGFLGRTLAGSGHHRMILMGYGGFGTAILLSGMIGMAGVVGRDRLAAAYFIYSHVILLIFLLIGVRHLFSLPVELGANWIFQLTEGEGRRQWLQAVDRFVLVPAAAAMLVAPLPLEVRLLGWHAFEEAALFAFLGLLSYEALFASWDKLPFTCSYLPGKKPMWIQALKLMALVGSLPAVNALLLECLRNPTLFVIVLAGLAAAWLRVRAARRDNWKYLRLRYTEVPDPAVHSLNLLR